MENPNDKIDRLMNTRQAATYDYARSTAELVEMGVKIGDKETGEVSLPKNFEPYLDKYNISNLEFEWEVVYKDGGKILRQFEDGQERTIKDIDQSKISKIAFISNFNCPTENTQKQVIAILNWETGIFEFLNGFVSQDTRAIACLDPIPGEKKLILKTKKRFSASNGEIEGRYKDFFPFQSEFFYYNRFILGYEVSGVGKKMIIINPDGTILNFIN